jgi:DNA-binding response OmpR family regulator
VEWIRAEIGAQPPILVLTAQSHNPTHEQALRAGANDVAFKPVPTTDLIARIQALL